MALYYDGFLHAFKDLYIYIYMWFNLFFFIGLLNEAQDGSFGVQAALCLAGFNFVSCMCINNTGIQYHSGFLKVA